MNKAQINERISCVRAQYIDLHQEKVYLCIKCTLKYCAQLKITLSLHHQKV